MKFPGCTSPSARLQTIKTLRPWLEKTQWVKSSKNLQLQISLLLQSIFLRGSEVLLFEGGAVKRQNTINSLKKKCIENICLKVISTKIKMSAILEELPFILFFNAQTVAGIERVYCEECIVIKSQVIRWHEC